MSIALDHFYPRGVFTTTSLTTTPQAVDVANPAAAGGAIRMNGLIARNVGAAAATITFSRPGAGADYFTLTLDGLNAPWDPTLVEHFPFHFVDGLEVESSTAVASVVSLTITFFDV